jgi:hypothetical protein
MATSFVRGGDSASRTRSRNELSKVSHAVPGGLAVSICFPIENYCQARMEAGKDSRRHCAGNRLKTHTILKIVSLIVSKNLENSVFPLYG